MEGSENEFEFECFIQSLNFRTLFNIPSFEYRELADTLLW